MFSSNESKRTVSEELLWQTSASASHLYGSEYSDGSIFCQEGLVAPLGSHMTPSGQQTMGAGGAGEGRCWDTGR